MPKVKEIRLFDGYEKNAAYIVKEPNTNSSRTNGSRRKRATKRALCTFLGIALVSLVVAVVIIIVVG